MCARRPAELGTLLLRADAGPRVGVGHVMRSLALAQAWIDEGGACVLASASLPASLRRRLLAEAVVVEDLAVEPGTPADAAATKGLAERHGVRVVAADGYAFGEAFQTALRKGGALSLLVADDYGHCRRYHADWILNPNLDVAPQLYAGREPSSRLLLGPRFALLRREFRHGAGSERAVRERGGRVLVTFGGADEHDLTGAVLDALVPLASEDLEVVALVGAANPRFTEVREREPWGGRVLRDVEDVARWIGWADVAISGGGSTCWELACLGLPALVIVTARNQVSVAEGLARRGSVRNLGWHSEVSPEDIRRSVAALLASAEARTAMSRAAGRVTDGLGARRVVAALARGGLLLREARGGDRELLWGWANDARPFAVDPSHIPLEHHRAWLEGRLGSPDCAIRVAELDGEPVGQVRIDRLAGGDIELDYYVAASFRERGLGTRLLEEAVRLPARLWPGISGRVTGLVREENAASARCFAKAGFTFRGTEARAGIPLMRFVHGER